MIKKILSRSDSPDEPPLPLRRSDAVFAIHRPDPLPILQSRLVERFAPFLNMMDLSQPETLCDSQDPYARSSSDSAPPEPGLKRPRLKEALEDVSEGTPEWVSQNSIDSVMTSQEARHAVALANARAAITLSKGYQLGMAIRKATIPLPDMPFTPPHFLERRPYACLEFRNARCRPAMEDTVSVTPIYDGLGKLMGTLYGVFDGHGVPGLVKERQLTAGKCVADYFAEDIPGRFKQYMTESKGDIEHSLLMAFKLSDLNARTVEPLSEHSGSTGLCVFVYNGIAYIANVGDSRAIICNGKEADQVTLDHDLIHVKLSELTRIADAGLKVENGRILGVSGALNMTRTLGNWSHTGKEGLTDGHRGGVSGTPDIFAVPLLPTDTKLVLACDGVFDVLTNDEIAALIEGVESSHLCAKLIMDAAIQKGSTDNISVVVVDLQLGGY